MYSDYAMWYSEERNSNQVLLSKLLTGKVFQCTERMDGQGRQPGYDSHYSPSAFFVLLLFFRFSFTLSIKFITAEGNEIIVFESAQILPRYIITFEEREAEEREQED